MGSIINQSDNKRIYKSLQKNNDLLKKLFEEVVQNDKAVCRNSNIEGGEGASVEAYVTKSDSKSERMGQFLADLESILSSTPKSTPRMAVISKGAPRDEELQNIRASFYKLDSKFSDYGSSGRQDCLPCLDFASDGEIEGLASALQGFSMINSSAPNSKPTFSVEAPQTPKTANANINQGRSAEAALVAPQSSALSPDTATSQDLTKSPSDLDALMCIASDSPTSRLVLKTFEEQTNAALKDADEAPEEISLLRKLAKRCPRFALNLINNYYRCECDKQAHVEPGWTYARREAQIDQDPRRQDAAPSALQLAGLCNDHAAVLWLMDEGVNINAKGSSDRTPLQNSMLADNIKLMEFMLSHGADISTRDNQGLSAFEPADIYLKSTHLRHMLRIAIRRALGGHER